MHEKSKAKAEIEAELRAERKAEHKVEHKAEHRTVIEDEAGAERVFQHDKADAVTKAAGAPISDPPAGTVNLSNAADPVDAVIAPPLAPPNVALAAALRQLDRAYPLLSTLNLPAELSVLVSVARSLVDPETEI